MKSIDDYWYSQNPISWLLLPVSWIFYVLALLRRWLYRSGILKSYRLSVPLVVVGNISVGGTGKTPLLIALCDLLKKQDMNPGIVSRGYGGNFTGERIVESADVPASVGDEPYLIMKRTGCPVAVGKNRVAAVELLLKHHVCDVVLSDDGLQHYRMRRDLEIAVVDDKRKFGNGFFIPAGPLREPVSRLSTVDIVAHHGQTTHDHNFYLEFLDAVNLVTGEIRPVKSFTDHQVHAVAGIGYPERFFEQLEKEGLTVTRHAFPDHHVYTVEDLAFDATGNSPNSANEVTLLTEKDAVKCTAFAAENHWYIPVAAKLSDNLISDLMNKIKRSRNA